MLLHIRELREPHAHTRVYVEDQEHKGCQTCHNGASVEARNSIHNSQIMSMNVSITTHNQLPWLAIHPPLAGHLVQRSGICGAKNLELQVSEPDPEANEEVTLLETGNAKEGPEEGEGVGEEDGVVAVGHVEDALWWVSGDDEILFRCQNAQILARPDVEAPNLAVVGGC